MGDLESKVLEAISKADRITKHFDSYGCGAHVYRITERLTVHSLCNGCPTMWVLIDGIRVDGNGNRVSDSVVTKAIDERVKQIAATLIGSF
jgi:hypothetical protein